MCGYVHLCLQKKKERENKMEKILLVSVLSSHYCWESVLSPRNHLCVYQRDTLCMCVMENQHISSCGIFWLVLVCIQVSLSLFLHFSVCKSQHFIHNKLHFFLGWYTDIVMCRKHMRNHAALLLWACLIGPSEVVHVGTNIVGCSLNEQQFNGKIENRSEIKA